MTYRIQKLLFSEYSDFEDTVLVESPFAETTREGQGVRQVQIGLTPTKFIVASYHLEPADGVDKSPETQAQAQAAGVRGDPDIESFELVLAYPVESVNLSVFRHRRRQTIKARFSNGNVAYYEIGGWSERKMVWKVWCERLRFLAPYESRTSASETSVGSSLSSEASVAASKASKAASTSLYIVRSTLSITKTGLPTLWCHYASSDQPAQPSTWSDPHLYLGPSFNEKGINFLCLPDVGKKMTQRATEESEKMKRTSMKGFPALSEEMETLARRAVELWESRRILRRTPRTHGIWPFPGLHSGLGLWRVARPQAYSLQMKRCASEVSLCSIAPRAELPRVPPNLGRTTSYERLPLPPPSPDQLYDLDVELTAGKSTEKELVAFAKCDPEVKMEWNRKEYKRQQKRLSQFRQKSSTLITAWIKERRKTSRARLNGLKILQETNCRQSSSETIVSNAETCSRARKKRSILTVKGPSTMASFTTSSIAHQLIMIDKQLFLSLATLELSRVRKDMGGARGEHLTRLMAFSHRVTCLVAEQIISEKELKERAVLVVRWTGVAYKCHRAHAMQPAESVLRGLQCPAVYRMARTWAYVRRHHVSKYRRFVDLCRRYKDARHPLYLQAYQRARRAIPNLPSAALLVAALTQRLAKLTPATAARFPSESCLDMTDIVDTLKYTEKSSKPVPHSLGWFLSAFNFKPSTSSQERHACTSAVHLHALDSLTLESNLGHFFAPVTGERPPDRAMEEAQFFLATHRAAAARYAMPFDRRARARLLLAPADGLDRLFDRSKRTEASKE